MRVLLVGGGGREHAIAIALCQHPGLELYSVMSNESPGIADLSRERCRHDESDIPWVVGWAKNHDIDWAFVGFEDPLALGMCDALENVGIATVGPNRAAAQLESSKLFTRQLMKKYSIPGQVNYHYFEDTNTLTQFLRSSTEEFALKPVGLTAGKGVKVMGIQITSLAEAIEYGCEVINQRIGGTTGIILEERLVGEEFTLQCFVDGNTVLPMPAVQDYKRALEGDKGPNTGGMGSYSQSDGLLPFLSQTDYDTATDILRKVVGALKAEGTQYRGILYGQFMVTPDGVQLVEINARFGDPEALNVIPLLQSDLVDICTSIIGGTLDSIHLSFDKKATVCKYIVPAGYGFKPEVGLPITVRTSQIASLGASVFFAKVDRVGEQLLTTSSRAVAILGTSETVSGAESIVEQALQYVEGEFDVRHDIGKIRPTSSALLEDRTFITVRDK